MAAVFSWLPLFISADPIGLKIPAQPSKKLAQAVDLLGKGHLDQADALFKQVTENEPGYLDATLGRAQIAITEKQLDDADKMVTGVLRSRDSLPEAHNMKGVVLVLRKDPAGARREFERAVALRPNYITPRVYLAVLCRISGNFTGAIVEYQKLTAIAPRLPAGYLGQAESQMQLGRKADATNVLEAWKAADPKSVLPYQVLANIALVDHQPDVALRQAHAGLAKLPRDPVTMVILGDAYEALGDVRSAAQQFEAALASDRANVQAAVHLGELEAASGQTYHAMMHFRLALASDPNNAVACNDVAWLLAESGRDLDEALRLAELASKRNPQYADAHDTLGWIHYRRGEYSAAVMALRQAKVLAPDNLDVAGHLGLAYSKTGQKVQALSELKRALQSHSNNARPEEERVYAELSTSISQAPRASAN